MKKNSTADMQVKHLQEDIKRLSGELAATEKLTDYYADSFHNAEKQRIACRRLIKYHTMVMVLMNLVSRYTDNNDLGTAIQTNINQYYKGLTEKIMSIPGDDEYNEEENEDREEEY
jgi:hypothetical protein